MTRKPCAACGVKTNFLVAQSKYCERRKCVIDRQEAYRKKMKKKRTVAKAKMPEVRKKKVTIDSINKVFTQRDMVVAYTLGVMDLVAGLEHDGSIDKEFAEGSRRVTNRALSKVFGEHAIKSQKAYQIAVKKIHPPIAKLMDIVIHEVEKEVLDLTQSVTRKPLTAEQLS